MLVGAGCNTCRNPKIVFDTEHLGKVKDCLGNIRRIEPKFGTNDDYDDHDDNSFAVRKSSNDLQTSSFVLFADIGMFFEEFLIKSERYFQKCHVNLDEL